jgi:hypothetical protein
MKKCFPYAISIDWLQLNCRALEPLKEVVEEKTYSPFVTDKAEKTNLYNRGFIAKERGYGSKVFQNVYLVEEIQKTESGAQRTEPFATIAFNPYCVRLANTHQDKNSAGLCTETCIVKLENKVLYEGNLWERITRFLDAFYLEYRGITRIDICYDCNFLLNGKSPQKLMSDFDAGRIRRAGARDYLAYKSQSMWIRNKVSKENLDPVYYLDELHGKGGENKVKSLTWGFRGRSSLQAQIYNKTAELKAGKENNPNYKCYIEELWRERGFDEGKDVFRFEVRISADSKELLDLNSKQHFKLGIDDVSFQESLEEVFACYANKAFAFFKPDPNIVRQDRLPRLELFCCNMDVSMKTKHFKKDTNHTRTLKILRNYLSNQIEQANPDNSTEQEAERKTIYRMALAHLSRDLFEARTNDLKRDREALKDNPIYMHGLIEETAHLRQERPSEFADDELNKKTEKKAQTRAFAVDDVYDATCQDKDLVAMIDNYTEEDEAEISEVLRLERLTDCYGSDDLPF